MRSILLILGLAACSGEIDQQPWVCADPLYGNGTCELDPICGVTDVDCFLTFQDDETAESWFKARDPAAVLVPHSDPRYTRLRGLLDRGWAAYQATNDVGELAQERPTLVIVDSPAINAYVTTDSAGGSMKSVLSVQFFTGLLTLNPSDDELIAVIMHELEHAIALHPFPETKRKLWKYYRVTGDEPLGFLQPDDPMVRQHIEQWRALAEDAGHYTDEEISGLPMANGAIFTTLAGVIELLGKQTPAACQANIQELVAAFQAVEGRIVKLDQSLDVEGSNLKVQIDTALAHFRDQCMAGITDDYATIHAAIHKLDPVMYRNSLSPSDRTLIDGRHFINGMYSLVLDRRARMREVETNFTTATGKPWSSARYFTTEEAADDSIIAVLDDMGLDPVAGARILPKLMGLADPSLPACFSLLDGGQLPPYGENLLDDHHGDCWRAHNVKALATSDHSYANNGREVSLIKPPAPPWAVHVPMMRAKPPYEIMY